MADLNHIEQIPSPPQRGDDSHKGTYGTVIVIGGCPTMLGAPAIAARAALRMGTGLVKLAGAAHVLPHTIMIEPGATGIVLQGDTGAMLDALDRADPHQRAVLAVGPGMGQAEELGPLITALLRGKRAMVLDADGLNLLAASGQRHAEHGPPLVMTPHPGEFARLARPARVTASATDPQQRVAAAAALAAAHGAVVVLKGHHTVVSDGRRVFVNDTGNPALATAGTGDVLTGALASLMGQGMEAFDAAVLAVHVHGRAADGWANIHGRSGLLARELADALTDALNRRRT